MSDLIALNRSRQPLSRDLTHDLIARGLAALKSARPKRPRSRLDIDKSRRICCRCGNWGQQGGDIGKS